MITDACEERSRLKEKEQTNYDEKSFKSVIDNNENERIFMKWFVKQMLFWISIDHLLKEKLVDKYVTH